MKMTKNCCPFCGSKNITIDVDITVSTYFENGILIINKRDFNIVDEAIEAAGYDQMCGFCYYCGAYFTVDHIDDSGVYFKTHQEEEQWNKKN